MKELNTAHEFLERMGFVFVGADQWVRVKLEPIGNGTAFILTKTAYEGKNPPDVRLVGQATFKLDSKDIRSLNDVSFRSDPRIYRLAIMLDKPAPCDEWYKDQKRQWEVTRIDLDLASTEHIAALSELLQTAG